MLIAHAYTIHVPATRKHAIPGSIAVLRAPDGSAVALATRRTLSRERMLVALHRHFGNRACWPEAKRHRWVAKIHAPAPKAEDKAEVEQGGDCTKGASRREAA